jgi:tRNA(Ile)-lysidine synthetase-like protein
MSEPKEAINTVLASLRRLIPDQSQTLLVCCSGGADSMALLFCAQKAGYPLHVVHALHDMRPLEEASKDRDLVKAYCEANSLSFSQVDINLKGNNPPSTEAEYRDRRYFDIYCEAREKNIKYALTGHHADDQLETILMKLCRGSGLRGLSGIAETLECADSWKHYSLTYARPMLRITKQDAYDICNLNKIPYNEDQTNKDTHYTRNKIRHEVVPVLKSIFPNAATLSNNCARAVDSAQKVVEDEAYRLKRFQKDSFDRDEDFRGPWFISIPTDTLRVARDIVVYECLRNAFDRTAKLHTTQPRHDLINSFMIEQVVSTIKSRQKRKFEWPNKVGLFVGKENVTFSPLPRDDSDL